MNSSSNSNSNSNSISNNTIHSIVYIVYNIQEDRQGSGRGHEWQGDDRRAQAVVIVIV